MKWTEARWTMSETQYGEFTLNIKDSTYEGLLTFIKLY